jgi:hypothetical protein
MRPSPSIPPKFEREQTPNLVRRIPPAAQVVKADSASDLGVVVSAVRTEYEVLEQRAQLDTDPVADWYAKAHLWTVDQGLRQDKPKGRAQERLLAGPTFCSDRRTKPYLGDGRIKERVAGLEADGHRGAIDLLQDVVD